MVQRPQSVGSLADDRDYSRKILRVYFSVLCCLVVDGVGH